MYKIIAIDADGTLLNNDTQIPEENREALLRAQRNGVHIALCSGRAVVSLRKFHSELGLDPARSSVISFNGAAVFNGYMEQIREVRMDRSLLSYILRETEQYKLMTIIYQETDKMFIKLSPRGMEEYYRYYSKSYVQTIFTDDPEKELYTEAYKVLFLGKNNDVLEVERHMLDNARDMEYSMFLSSPVLLEFTSPLSSKAVGLDFMCKQLGLDIKRDAIAIGDSFNDLSMIQEAALGVCMCNGEEEVKAAADYVTKRDNHMCGVAEVVNKFIFNKE